MADDYRREKLSGLDIVKDQVHRRKWRRSIMSDLVL